MSARLATGIRVHAHRARVERAGRVAMVLRRGAESGAVLVKVNRMDGFARVLDRWTGLDGTVEWSPVPREAWSAEADIDAYLQRRLDADPDLWAVEVESADGEGFTDADMP